MSQANAQHQGFLTKSTNRAHHLLRYLQHGFPLLSRGRLAYDPSVERGGPAHAFPSKSWPRHHQPHIGPYVQVEPTLLDGLTDAGAKLVPLLPSVMKRVSIFSMCIRPFWTASRPEVS
jgi:hypothetical protein